MIPFSILFNKDKDRVNSPPFPLYIALFFLLVCTNALVAKFVVFTFEIVPGVSSFYFVVVCMIVFSLWFGMWGAIAAYLGCYIGAGILSGIPLDVSLYWSLADFWEALIPLLAFRAFNGDPSLSRMRDLVILVFFGIIVNNLIGALWGSWTLILGGIIQSNEFTSVFLGWFIVNFVISIIFIPPILYFLTPSMQEHELYIERFWN